MNTFSNCRQSGKQLIHTNKTLKGIHIKMKTNGVLKVSMMLALVCLTCLLPVVCNSADDDADKLITEERSIELGGEKSVQVNLDFSCGQIKAHAGSEKLMDAKFTCNYQALMPDLDYKVKQEVGELRLRQQIRKNIGNSRSEWDLSFNNSVPLDISINSASGGSMLDFSKLCITRLNIDTRSGGTSLDLSGDHRELTSVNVDKASGSLKAVFKGCYSSLTKVCISSASGNTDIDLSGDWEQNADITISSASGNVRMKLPEDVGVRLIAHAASGNLRTSGMNAVDGVRVNAAYGHSKATLNIKIESGSGNVVVK